jgi:ATP-dependent Zn protease
VYFAHKKQGQFINPTQEGSGEYGAMTAHLIDKEFRQIIDEQYDVALEILESKTRNPESGCWCVAGERNNPG